MSTQNARHCTLETKDFYLNSSLDKHEHLRLSCALFTQELIYFHHLNDRASENGYVYWEIRGGMHGLSQAGMLVHETLKKNLKLFGHELVTYTPGLWINEEQKNVFCICS